MCDLLHTHLLSYNIQAHFSASSETEQHLLDRHAVGDDRSTEASTGSQDIAEMQILEENPCSK